MSLDNAEQQSEGLALADVLASLEMLSPDATEYLKLYLDMLGEFETDGYRENPQSVSHCFPNGLDDDVNELIGYFDDLVAANPEAAGTIIKNFEQVLRETKPVTYHTLLPLFRHIGHEPVDQEQDGPIRFRMANLRFNTRKEYEAFLRACDLIEFKDEGKGGHKKWRTVDGITVDHSNGGPVVWVKNVIKNLLNNGVDIDKIVQACAKLKIDFTIID